MTNKPPTPLGMRLALPETYQAALEAIDQAYQIEGDIGRTAAKLGVSKRTLERMMRDYPEVGTVIERTRAARRIVRAG